MELAPKAGLLGEAEVSAGNFLTFFEYCSTWNLFFADRSASSYTE